MSEAFNRLIRQAAGRGVAASAGERELERPVGDIVGRRVPGPAVLQRRPTSNAFVNERIRLGARIIRSVQLRDGLNLDLDDPWR